MLDPLESLATSTTRGTTQDKTQENKSLKGVDKVENSSIIKANTNTRIAQDDNQTF
jgi:hypothetical protein